MTTYVLAPAGIYVGATTGAWFSIPAGGTFLRFYASMGIVIALNASAMLQESFDGGATARDVSGFATVYIAPLPEIWMVYDGSARRLRAVYTVLVGVGTSSINVDIT